MRLLVHHANAHVRNTCCAKGFGKSLSLTCALRKVSTEIRPTRSGKDDATRRTKRPARSSGYISFTRFRYNTAWNLKVFLGHSLFQFASCSIVSLSAALHAPRCFSSPTSPTAGCLRTNAKQGESQKFGSTFPAQICANGTADSSSDHMFCSERASTTQLFSEQRAARIRVASNVASKDRGEIPPQHSKLKIAEREKAV